MFSALKVLFKKKKKYSKKGKREPNSKYTHVKKNNQ